MVAGINTIITQGKIMKMYFKEQPDHAVTLTSETGEDLWQFTSMADAIRACREFQCLNEQIYIESNDPNYQKQA